ncbi:MAG TPA: zinc ribbon domain-containing protein [Pyrinomonadaceae bacterium]|jgi:hypothetical protein|nr:zinc ribbon domain-containing protein [Pyrinomonadaceae bacterium]
MAETLVEKKICEACGADVRPGSLFCYNCGGAVQEDLPKTEKNNNQKDVSNAWLKSDLVENSDLKTTQLKRETVEAKPIEKPIEKPLSGGLLEKIEEKPVEKTLIREDAKLKSAANLRRKAKIYQKKTVEVVWEEPENAPNKWFPIVAILLILFVVGIFYLAMYMK